MQRMFDEKELKRVIKNYSGVPEDLAVRIYTSRLIGMDSDLVLHGGGNASVKLIIKNIFGEDREVLFVKGSGVNMADIGPEGFTGLELSTLRKFRDLEHLSDEEMDNQLRINKLDARSPDPSVESLLHAFLPHKFIDHTHADAILALTNRKDGKTVVQEALGPKTCVIPYQRSGLPLAKAAVGAWESQPDAEAIVVIHHGIFTFADEAKAAFQLMTEYVSRAQSWLLKRRGHISGPGIAPCDDETYARVCQAVRGACAYTDASGNQRRFYVDIRSEPDIVDASLSREAREICKSGVLTPDHAIRTKNQAVYVDHIPDKDEGLKTLLERTLKSYKKDYEKYFALNNQAPEREMLDPFPRVFLVAGMGLLALGHTREAARTAADIAEHTVRTKRLCGLKEYVPIPEQHVFDMEYWPIQQKKLPGPPVQPLQGQAALVTGAAGAIGFGIAERLIAAGASVVASDIDEAGLERVHSILVEKYSRDRVEIMVFDVTDYRSVEQAFVEASLKLGGIDILVPNAGTAHVAKIEDMGTDTFHRVLSVNLMGTFNTIKASIPVFRRQGTGGNIVVISTKNVFDPGAAFGAYSASKAAAHQISRIAALELADLGVRVNMVNPDAVFGDEKVPSKLWELIGPERMKARGLDPAGLREYYRQRNLLKAPVYAEHVGNAVVFFARGLTPTTGATLPVDGGVPAAFPR